VAEAYDYVLFVISRDAPSGRRVVESPIVEMPGETLLHQSQNDRIAVADVLGWLAAGQTYQQILDDFPELTEDDIRACLAYAADRERRLITAAT
jgi:hypothetical protein